MNKLFFIGSIVFFISVSNIVYGEQVKIYAFTNEEQYHNGEQSFNVSYTFNPSINVCSKYLISPSGRRKLIEENVNCQTHVANYSSPTIVDFFKKFGLAPESGTWHIEVTGSSPGLDSGATKAKFSISFSKNFPPVISNPKLSTYKIEERKSVNVEAEVVDDINIKKIVAIVKYPNGTSIPDSPFIMTRKQEIAGTLVEPDKYKGTIVTPSVPAGDSIDLVVYIEAIDSYDAKENVSVDRTSSKYPMILNAYNTVSGTALPSFLDSNISIIPQESSRKTDIVTKNNTPFKEDQSISNKKQINILLEDAIKISEIDKESAKIELIEKSKKSVYSVIGVKQVKLLFMIPVSMEVKTEVDAETGKVISVSRPWWSFLSR